MNRRLGLLETRFDSGFADLRAEIRVSRNKTNAKLDGLDSKMDGLSTKMDKLEAKIDSRFNLVTLLYVFIAALQLTTALGLFNRAAPYIQKLETMT